MRPWLTGVVLLVATCGCWDEVDNAEDMHVRSDSNSGPDTAFDAVAAPDALDAEVRPEPIPPANPWEAQCSSGDSWYITQYFNAVVVAKDISGRKLVVAAGRHGKFFPYFQKTASWDNVLVQLDGQGYSAAGQRLEGFALGVDEAAGTVHLYFSGVVLPQQDATEGGRPRPAGSATAADLLLDLHLSATFYDEKFLGVDMGAAEGIPPGITLRPVFLEIGGGQADSGAVAAASTVRLSDGPAFEPISGVGELEISTISYFKDPTGAFRYDYLCAASLGQESSGSPFAFVAFQGHALKAEGPGGEMFEKLLSGAMKWEFTLTSGGLAETNDFTVPVELLLAGGKVAAMHAEDVGLGIMTRELVCTQYPPVCGLRESVK